MKMRLVSIYYVKGCSKYVTIVKKSVFRDMNNKPARVGKCFVVPILVFMEL